MWIKFDDRREKTVSSSTYLTSKILKAEKKKKTISSVLYNIYLCDYEFIFNKK